MQHLNYCRQAAKYLEFYLRENKKHQYRHIIVPIIKKIESAVKFILPKNGRIIGDTEFRAIQNESELNLPFNVIALEYERDATNDTCDTYGGVTKSIVIAEDAGDKISMTMLMWISNMKSWGPAPAVLIPKKNFFAVREKGKTTVNIEWNQLLPFSDFEDEVGALFDFLNALACKNVHIEKSPAKATKQGKMVKASLPFDDYHFLTVDVPSRAGVRGEGLGGSHRSPREHLRRGHIRRHESGPIWVNACVVNAGIGSKVGKSYLLRNRSQNWG